MSLFKCLVSFLLLFTIAFSSCKNEEERSIERPQPVKSVPLKKIEIKVPAIIKPVSDTLLEDTLKHYHQETNKSIDTKYLKKSFNLHKKPFVA